MRSMWLSALCFALVVGCGEGSSTSETVAPEPSGLFDGMPAITPASLPMKLPMPSAFQVSGGSVKATAIKNGTAPVMGTFSGIRGSLKMGGTPAVQTLTAHLEIALESYDSALELRDDRVKSLFFDVAKHGTAHVALESVDPLPAGAFPIGATVEIAMKGTLSLHGATVPVETLLAFRRPTPISLEAKTITPVSVSIAALGMNGPLQALIKECAHASVEDGIAIDADLAFAAGATRMPAVLPHPHEGRIKGKVKAPIKRVK
jgi:hypothetical protein